MHLSFKTPFTCVKKSGTACQIFGTVPRLPLLRLPPRGSLSTPKILSTGATLHVGPIRLHVENWECRALKSSARWQKLGCRADFFSACKWGLRRAVNAERVSPAVIQSSLLLFVTSLYTVMLVRHICLT